MDKKQEIMLSRIADACENNFDQRFFGFFDEAMQLQALKILRSYRVPYVFWGGFRDAGRKMLCVYPEYLSEDEIEWPMSAVRFPIDFSLTHRNVLGEIMAYGITRECVGDINVTSEEVQIIFQSKMQPYFEQNLHKIKNHSVKPVYYDHDGIKAYDLELKRISIVAASVRTDCVIGKIWGLSRNDAVTCIHQKRLRVNYEEVTKPDHRLKSGDIIALRGKGKAQIVATEGLTKKGNLRIEVDKYV